MVIIVLGLILIVLVAVFLVQARDLVLKPLLWWLFILTVIFVSSFFGIRYRLTTRIPCLPNCPGVNFVGRDLRDRDLSNTNLVEGQLVRAILAGAQLQNADLSGANIQMADLKNADLSFAFLIGANLRNSDLTGANLTETSLLGADLTGADLSGIDLSTTHMHGAIFDSATMVDANLSGSFLSGLDFQNADLSGVNLHGADLSGATLSGANLSGADMTEANLQGATLNLTILNGANLTHADLSGSSLVGSDMSSSILQDATIVGAAIMGTNLNGADFRGANLQHVRGANQITDQELLVDKTIATLNSLQLAALRRPPSLDGVIFNDSTSADAGTLPPVVESRVVDSQNTVRVGILHSVSGALAAVESPILDATLLAIEEINSDGGVLGHRIDPIVEDGASSGAVFAQKAEKLLTLDQVEAIFGAATSPIRMSLLSSLEESDGLLFYPTQFEGLENSPNIIYMGSDPSQQIVPTIQYLLDEGHDSFYLIGNDTAYTRIVNGTIKAMLAEHEANVAGENILALGSTDLDAAIREMEFLDPDIVLNSLISISADSLFDALDAEQISPATLPVLSFRLSETEIQSFGASQLAGHLVASSYYQTISSVANFTFVERFRDAYGRSSVTSSSVANGYNAVYLWKELVEAAGSFELDDIQQAMQTEDISFEGPNGLVELDPSTHQLFQTVRIGQIREDGQIDEIFALDEAMKPDPFLEKYEWAKPFVQDYLDNQQ